MTFKRLTIGIALAVAASGCFGFERKSSPTAPSGAGAFAGSWSSAAAIGVPPPDSCSQFQWQVTDVSGQTVSGTFSATCAGGLSVQGTGSGTLNGSSLNWTATGTATQSGLTCSFTLSGTAVPEGTDAIRVNYSGQVCGIAVSGSELLRRR